MALFQNSKQEGNTALTMDFLVASDAMVSGDIQTKGHIRIEGEVWGNVTAGGNIHIGDRGKVYGNVTGTDIQIAGELEGDALASGIVTLYGCAKMRGDIVAKGFNVGEGSCYNGHVDIPPESSITLKEDDKRVAKKAEIPAEETIAPGKKAGKAKKAVPEAETTEIVEN